MNTDISYSMLKRICTESFTELVLREKSSICSQLLQPELMKYEFKEEIKTNPKLLEVIDKGNYQELLEKLKEYGDLSDIYELLMDEQDKLLDELEDQEIKYGSFYSKEFEYVKKKGFDEIDNMIMILSKLRVTLLVKKNYD